MSTASTPPNPASSARKQKWTSKLRRKPKNPTGEMTLVQHLQELRRRIVISLLALVVGTIIGFIWYQNAPFNMAPLGEILRLVGWRSNVLTGVALSNMGIHCARSA